MKAARQGFGLTGIAVLLFGFLCVAVAGEPSKSGVSPHAISLPSGPGSIEGLGESFEPQINMGNGHYALAMKLPPGRAGFAPSVGLAYDSGNGNGPVGVGWSLTGHSIRRQTDKGLPNYSTNAAKPDTFITEGGEELVRVAGAANDTVQVYRLKNEGSFNRYTFFADQDRWEMLDRSGIRYSLGARMDQSDVSARIRHPRLALSYAWQVAEAVDLNGNRILFSYTADQGQVYCRTIEYGFTVYPSANTHLVEFAYEARPDPVIDYRPTFRLVTAKRLKQVSIKTAGKLVRQYRLDYALNTPLSRLIRFTLVGNDGVSTLPPAEFSYSDAALSGSGNLQALTGLSTATLLLKGESPDAHPDAAEVIDFDGDSLPDLYQSRSYISGPTEYDVVYRNLGKGAFQRVDLNQAASLGLAIQAQNSFVKDVNGDGLVDLIAQTGSNTEDLAFRLNGGGRWLAGQTSIILPANNTLENVFKGADVRSVDLNFDKQMDTLRSFTTIGASGLGVAFSAYLNRGDGHLDFVPQTTTDIVKGVPTSFSEMRGVLVLADMNGDRLLDLVWLKDATNGGPRYWPSMGNGQFDDSVSGYPAALTDGPDFGGIPGEMEKLELEDINNDGLADLLQVTGSQIRYWLNEGGTRFGKQSTLSLSAQFDPSSATYRLLDMDGDGLQDLAFYVRAQLTPDAMAQGFWMLRLFRDKQGQLTDKIDNDKDGLIDEADEGNSGPNLLGSISNGIGKTTSLLYGSHVQEMLRDAAQGNPWKTVVPFATPVLQRLDVHDGSRAYITRFSYHDGYYDGKEKEFRGFASAERLEEGDASAPDLITRYQFDTGVTVEALKGKALAMTERNAAGQDFHSETYSWTTKQLLVGSVGDSRSVVFAKQDSKLRTVAEQGHGDPVQLRWEFEYDDYGNTTVVRELGRLDSGWDDERTTVTSYSAGYPTGLAAWILDQPIEHSITDENGKLAARQRHYYDGNTSLGVISKGNETKTEDWVHDTTTIASKRSDYDAFGNAIALYDPLYDAAAKAGGHYREIDYDQVFHTFPVQERIYTGKTVLTAKADFDPGLGVVNNYTEFNGFTNFYAYDAFGRLTSIRKPGDSGATVEYGYTLARKLADGKLINWVDLHQRETDGGGTVDSRQFFDGLGRKVMTRAEGETPGQIVVSDTVQFNAQKTPWRQYLPYFETNASLDYQAPTFASAYVEHFYDPLGRELKAIQPTGEFSQIEYQPLSKLVHDEEQTNPNSLHFGAGMRYIEDGLENNKGAGRLREVHEIVKIGDDGNLINTPATWITRYRYDLLDNLTGYTDAQNNQKTIEYDGLGRQTFMNDPDRGQVRYEYDDASNLTKTLDAKNQTVRYQYDGANRITAEYLSAAGTNPEVEYHYDEPAGLLSHGDYWPLNNPEVITQSILTGQDADTGFDWNRDGQIDVADVVRSALDQAAATPDLQAANTRGYLAWVRDQSGEEHKSYDSRGRVAWTVKRIADPTGKLRNFYTGMAYDSMDRITTLTYPDQTLALFQYNPRGLLETIPGVIAHYDYNPVGQNLKLALANGVTTTYSYDPRQRLETLVSQRERDQLPLQSFRYHFDGVSNITRIDDQRSNDQLIAIGQELNTDAQKAVRFNATQSFQYDSLYRLTQARNDAVFGNIDYRYDRIGNLLRQNATLLNPEPDVDLGAVLNGGSGGTRNRLGRNPGDPPGPHALTATEKGTSGTLQYDANGNVQQDGGNTLLWDAKDRLAGMQSAKYQAQYAYDYRDSRKTKFVTDKSTGQAQMALYIDKFSEVREGKLVKYVYAGQNRIAQSDGTTLQFSPKYFYLQDHLGSTHFALSNTAAIVTQTTNYAYGRTRLENQNLPASGRLDYRFTGKERDAEIALDYFGARYFSGTRGKFVSLDWSVKPQPIPYADVSDPQTLNLYSYVRNNPLRIADPDGHCGLDLGCWGQFGSGVADTTYRPFIEMANHPLVTIDALGHAVLHPVETGYAIKNSVVETSKAALSGDPNAVGKVVGTVILTVFSGGAGGAAAKGVSLAEEIEATSMAARAAQSAKQASSFSKTIKGGESAATAAGRRAHKNYENTLGGGYDFNKSLPSGKRPDAIDWKNRVVRELKPDNPNAIRKGEKQLEGYKGELENMTGEPWTSHLDVYKK